jgi:hypothetical protein
MEGVDTQLHSFFTLTMDGDEWSTLHTGRFTPGKEPRYLSTFPLISLQLPGPATALSRKFLENLTTARHIKKLFCNMHNKKIPAARQ